MTLGLTSDPETGAVAGEARRPSGDDPLRLLMRLLARASDCRKPPVERAVLLARCLRLLNGLLVASAAARELPPEILHSLRAEYDRVLHDEVRPALREQGVTIVRWEQVSTTERNRLRTIFREVIYPLATPLVVDSAHPFPKLAGISLNVGVFVRDQRYLTERFACVPLPGRLFGSGLLDGGFVHVGAGRLIGVEMVVSALLDGLFNGMHVLERSNFRVIQDDSPVRSIARPACSSAGLEVDETMSERMLNVLVGHLHVGCHRVYRGLAPLALAERIVRVSEARGGLSSQYRVGQIARKTAEGQPVFAG